MRDFSSIVIGNYQINEHRTTHWDDKNYQRLELPEKTFRTAISHENMKFFQNLAALFFVLSAASRSILGAAFDSDPYRVLGLERGATWREARARYKTLSLQHHPDRGGDAERFKVIVAAIFAIEKELKSEQSAVSHEYGGHWSSISGQYHATIRLSQLYVPEKIIRIDKDTQVFRSPDIALGWKVIKIIPQMLLVSLSLVQGKLDPIPALQPFTLLPDSYLDVLYQAPQSASQTREAVVPSILTGRADTLLHLEADRKVTCPNSVPNAQSQACYKYAGMGVYGFRLFPQMSWGYGDMIVAVPS